MLERLRSTNSPISAKPPNPSSLLGVLAVFLQVSATGFKSGTLAPGPQFSDDLEPGAEAGYSTFNSRTAGGFTVMPDATAKSAVNAWVALDDQPGAPELTAKDDRLTLPPQNLGPSAFRGRGLRHLRRGDRRLVQPRAHRLLRRRGGPRRGRDHVGRRPLLPRRPVQRCRRGFIRQRLRRHGATGRHHHVQRGADRRAMPLATPFL